MRERVLARLLQDLVLTFGIDLVIVNLSPGHILYSIDL